MVGRRSLIQGLNLKDKTAQLTLFFLGLIGLLLRRAIEATTND